MNELIILFVISFFTGISVKIVDLIEDNGLRFFKSDRFIFAIIYGLLIGYTISNFNLVAPLWIGTIFAMVLAKKIDARSHLIGILSALAFIGFFGFEEINLTFLIIFLIAAFLDEILNDLADGKEVLKNKFLKFKKLKINKFIKKILELRIMLEITALIISTIISDYSLFFALLCFDIGYIASNKVFDKKKNLL